NLILAFLLALSVPPAVMRQAQPGMPPTDASTRASPPRLLPPAPCNTIVPRGSADPLLPATHLLTLPVQPSGYRVGRHRLPGFDVLQGHPLEHFRLRRVTVDRLGQPLERPLVRHRQRELADHFPGMRRDERRADNLATVATGIYRRKPLLLAVDKG